MLSCGSDLFPRWFREEPGDRIVSNTPAGSTGIDTTSGSGWKRPARNIFGTANQINGSFHKLLHAQFKLYCTNLTLENPCLSLYLLLVYQE